MYDDKTGQESSNDNLYDNQFYEASRQEDVYSIRQEVNIDNVRVKNGPLDLIYGVLFDPVRTFAGFTANPPVIFAAVIYLALNLLEALTGFYAAPRYLMQEITFNRMPGATAFMHALVPVVAVGGFLLGVVKWFFMAGLLHLVADLLGGSGRARQVFAVYSLAGLPALLMIPVDMLGLFIGAGSVYLFLSGLFGLAVFGWSVVILTIGVREVHRIGTGKALLTVFTPFLAALVLLVVGLVAFGSAVASLPEKFIP